MSKIRFYYYAEIIPGVSIGGVELGNSIDNLDLPLLQIKYDNDFEIMYTYVGTADFYVTKSDNKIYKIAVKGDYRGRFHNIGLGEYFSNLLNDGLVLKYDSFDSEFELDKVKGLRFGSNRRSFKFDQIPDLRVDYFTIFPTDINGYDEDDYRKIAKSNFV